MEKKVTISLSEVIGSPLCVASDDGQKVYDRLAAALNQNLHVSLSFRNVSALTAAFLASCTASLKRVRFANYCMWKILKMKI